MLSRFLYIFISLCISLQAYAAFRPVKLGYVDFPPFTYKEKDAPAGLLIDIVKPIWKKVGITIFSAELYPAARLFRLLRSGEVDMWLGIELHTDAIAYTQYPLAVLELDAWVMKGRPLPKIKNVEDLKGYRVALISGYAYGDWGARIRGPGSPFRWTDLLDRHQAFKFLAHGRADILLDYKDPLTMSLTKSQMKKLDYVKVQELEVKIGIARTYPKYAELIAALNSHMDEN
jgi:polar amino acid transport system substrate-binding protein